MVTLGKPIGSGVPAAIYGFGQAVADRIRVGWDYHAADECGVGGTLAGNMLSVAAVRATLAEVLTEEAYARMIPLAGRWADGVQGVIDEFALPWVVKRLGCRAEYWPRPVPPRNGGEAAAAEDEELDRYLHLFMLNRGILSAASTSRRSSARTPGEASRARACAGSHAPSPRHSAAPRGPGRPARRRRASGPTRPAARFTHVRTRVRLRQVGPVVPIRS